MVRNRIEKGLSIAFDVLGPKEKGIIEEKKLTNPNVPSISDALHTKVGSRTTKHVLDRIYVIFFMHLADHSVISQISAAAEMSNIGFDL